MVDGITTIVAATLRVMGRGIATLDGDNYDHSGILSEYGPPPKLNREQVIATAAAYDVIAERMLEGKYESLVEEVREELHRMDAAHD